MHLSKALVLVTLRSGHHNTVVSDLSTDKINNAEIRTLLCGASAVLYKGGGISTEVSHFVVTSPAVRSSSTSPMQKITPPL